jgi:hypothetical protein
MILSEDIVRSPFPGMNPYLEHHTLWHEIHTRLIVALADYLNPLLRPRYLAAIEERTYLALSIPDDLIGMPDVSVVELDSRAPTNIGGTAMAGVVPLEAEVPIVLEEKQRYLRVKNVESGDIVTAIEILSHSNKQAGDGREQYEEKRNEILATKTHLVEIDLLRANKPLPLRVHGATPLSDYRILVSRAELRPRAELYAFNVRDTIPTFPLPLQRGDAEPMVNLNELLNQVYDRGNYDLRVDYKSPPEPALRAQDREWANEIVRQQNLHDT